MHPPLGCTPLSPRLQVYVHPLIRGGFDTALLAAAATASAHAAASTTLPQPTPQGGLPSSRGGTSARVFSFDQPSSAPPPPVPAADHHQPRLGIGLTNAPDGAIVVAHLTEEYRARTVAAMAQSARVSAGQRGGALTRSAHTHAQHALLAQANAVAAAAAGAAPPPSPSRGGPGMRRPASAASLGGRGAQPTPRAGAARAAAVAAPTALPTDNWVDMLARLPPCEPRLAGAPGHAVGLAAARRHHLSVSSRSASIARAAAGASSSGDPGLGDAEAAALNPALLHVGDVIIALNSVSTQGSGIAGIAQKLLRLCHKTGTWVTVARPVGRLLEPGEEEEQAAAAAAEEEEEAALGEGDEDGQAHE